MQFWPQGGMLLFVFVFFSDSIALMQHGLQFIIICQHTVILTVG